MRETLQNATLLFEITTRCNLKCKHCFKNDYSKELTLVQIRTILEKVCAFGVIDLVLTGGEPFLVIIFGIFLSLAYIMPGTIPPGDVIFPHMVMPPTGGNPVLDPTMVLNQGLVNGALYGGVSEGIALVAWKILR